MKRIMNIEQGMMRAEVRRIGLGRSCPAAYLAISHSPFTIRITQYAWRLWEQAVGLMVNCEWWMVIRLPYFDLHHSLLDIGYSLFQHSITPFLHHSIPPLLRRHVSRLGLVVCFSDCGRIWTEKCVQR